jgi:ComF family protein
MKYQGASWSAPLLIELIRPHLADWLRDATDGAHIVPVPMSPWRQLRRGFNQAEAIATALAREWSRPLLQEGVLIRSQWRSPQARLKSREARMENLAGCFRITEPRAVAGRAFLLVDDVMTTGATAATAAASLQEAGASRIHILSIARASLRHPDADFVEAPDS